MYKLDMYCESANGKKQLLSPNALQWIYEDIMKEADETSVLNPGPLTSMDRDSWHKVSTLPTSVYIIRMYGTSSYISRNYVEKVILQF